MIAVALRNTTSVGFWGLVCLLFSLFIASGGIVLGAAILTLVLLVLLVLAGPNFILWLYLVGSPTVFGFANQVLQDLPFFTVERLLFVTLVGIIFLRSTFLNTPGKRFTRLEILMLVFLGYALGNLVMTTTEQMWRKDLWLFMQYGIPMCMYMVSRRIGWTEQGIRILLVSLTVTGVVMAVMGILQALFDVTLFDVKNVTQGHTERAYGTFANANTYIASLVVLLILTLFQFNLYRDGLARAALLATMLLMMAGIVLGQTRAPWGGAALALLIIFARDREIRPLLVVGSAIGAIIGAIVLFLMLDELGKFTDRIGNLETLATRLAVWATSVNMIVHNPVTGIGMGVDTFWNNKPEYLTGVGPIIAEYGLFLSVPHNEYLYIPVMLGIPALIVYFMIVHRLMRALFSAHQNPNGSPLLRRLALYVAAIVISLLFNGLFVDTHLQDYFWMLGYVLCGLVAAMDPQTSRVEELALGTANHPRPA
jgi:O-antigen ligase